MGDSIGGIGLNVCCKELRGTASIGFMSPRGGGERDR